MGKLFKASRDTGWRWFPAETICNCGGQEMLPRPNACVHGSLPHPQMPAQVLPCAAERQQSLKVLSEITHVAPGLKTTTSRDWNKRWSHTKYGNKSRKPPLKVNLCYLWWGILLHSVKIFVDERLHLKTGICLCLGCPAGDNRAFGNEPVIRPWCASTLISTFHNLSLHFLSASQLCLLFQSIVGGQCVYGGSG